MRIHDCIQGSPEWFYLRSGIPTASEFDRILTPKRAEPSKSADSYLFTLLAERIMGHPRAQFISDWMKRGSEMEVEAVKFYEFQQDSSTELVGFITNDAGTIGASPDRLAGTRGLLEIKAPSEAIHMAYLLESGGVYEDHRVQVQGQLWVSEREWVDVLSYHPELPMALVRVERDDAYIVKLATAVTAFSQKLEEYTAQLKAKGSIRSERYADSGQGLIQAMRDSLASLKT